MPTYMKISPMHTCTILSSHYDSHTLACTCKKARTWSVTTALRHVRITCRLRCMRSCSRRQRNLLLILHLHLRRKRSRLEHKRPPWNKTNMHDHWTLTFCHSKCFIFRNSGDIFTFAKTWTKDSSKCDLLYSVTRFVKTFRLIRRH